MILLKKGITGFNNQSTITNEMVSSFLKKIQFPFVPDSSKISAPNQSANFWRIPIKNLTSKNEFDLLINSSFWYLCLVTKESSWMDMQYLNFPKELTQQIENQKETEILLEKFDLESVFSDSELNQLDKTEIKQVKYWKSKTIGEIIFNGYD